MKLKNDNQQLERRSMLKYHVTLNFWVSLFLRVEGFCILWELTFTIVHVLVFPAGINFLRFSAATATMRRWRSLRPDVELMAVQCSGSAFHVVWKPEYSNLYAFVFSAVSTLNKPWLLFSHSYCEIFHFNNVLSYYFKTQDPEASRRKCEYMYREIACESLCK